MNINVILFKGKKNTFFQSICTKHLSFVKTCQGLSNLWVQMFSQTSQESQLHYPTDDTSVWDYQSIPVRFLVPCLCCRAVSAPQFCPNLSTQPASESSARYCQNNPLVGLCLMYSAYKSNEWFTVFYSLPQPSYGNNLL